MRLALRCCLKTLALHYQCQAEEFGCWLPDVPCGQPQLYTDVQVHPDNAVPWRRVCVVPWLGCDLTCHLCHSTEGPELKVSSMCPGCLCLSLLMMVLSRLHAHEPRARYLFLRYLFADARSPHCSTF